MKFAVLVALMVLFCCCVESPVDTSSTSTSTSTTVYEDVCKDVEPYVIHRAYTLAGPPYSVYSYTERNNCYRDLAVRSENVSFCYKIVTKVRTEFITGEVREESDDKAKDLLDECFLGVALVRLNSSICDKIRLTNSLRIDCHNRIALGENADKATTEETEEVDAVALAYEKVAADLVDALETHPQDYVGRFRKSRKVEVWAGHSGSENFEVDSEVFIEVEGGEVVNYSLRYKKHGFPVESEDYFEFFDASAGGLCREVFVGSSRCVVSEEPIPPHMEGVLRGCRVKSDRGKHSCLCDSKLVSISVTEFVDPVLPCIEDISTDGLELWDEFNIIYYRDLNESLCYFVTTEFNGSSFAFECLNEHIALIPTLDVGMDLSNVICYYRRYNALCTCVFSPVKVRSCRNASPVDFDLELKAEILDYLKKVVNVSSVSEVVDDRGRCFSFFYEGLDHVFCFDERNVVASAQWGSNLGEPGRFTDIDIKKVDRI